MLKVKFLKNHKRGKEGSVTNMREEMAGELIESGDVELIEGEYTPPVKEVMVNPNARIMNKNTAKKKASKKVAKKAAE